ncbi:MAG: accessory gene regulator B family protein [Ruminococcus sp.]
MIGTILLIAHISGILWEAMFLLFLYGTLKMCAGGIHFKRSSFCLIGTGIFVEGGVIYIKTVKYTIILYYYYLPDLSWCLSYNWTARH